MSRVLRHFGLSSWPFSPQIADADLWLPPARQALRDQLLDAIHQRDNVLLTAEPGAGKTARIRSGRGARSRRRWLFASIRKGRRSRCPPDPRALRRGPRLRAPPD